MSSLRTGLDPALSTVTRDHVGSRIIGLDGARSPGVITSTGSTGVGPFYEVLLDHETTTRRAQPGDLLLDLRSQGPSVKQRIIEASRVGDLEAVTALLDIFEMATHRTSFEDGIDFARQW